MCSRRGLLFLAEAFASLEWGEHTIVYTNSYLVCSDFSCAANDGRDSQTV